MNAIPNQMIVSYYSSSLFVRQPLQTSDKIMLLECESDNYKNSLTDEMVNLREGSSFWDLRESEKKGRAHAGATKVYRTYRLTHWLPKAEPT